ncbi:hypothetical protein KY290_024270 [Solanum tuberosum]|uniref:non-specific serine/threonine protein kinase n=1 Tax=Solanum tuberosum TaxID=4113 RepID=A0ABQ7UTD3_SOLTU|nr:hypothetical protein KY290_024270 [Solanum tuberosum]
MNFKKSSTFLSCIMFILLPSLITSQTCQKSCGNVPIKYPFGTGPGCGDPRFQPYVMCNNQQLSFKTHTGCYPVTSIDYNYQIMYISDPSMSTCACTQPSKGFSLDANAPFTFHDETVFALLDCATDSSPIYKSNNEGTNSTFPMCDSQGAPVCSLLYSCQAISRLNLPISTCCVYTPVDLGPAFEMDLEKLQCSSYSALYGFSGEELNPQAWKYGIALKYKFNFNNDYPDMCANCEKSNGVCGYGGPYSSFVCNCPSGFNTTNDCFLGSSWSNSFKNVPWHIGVLLINALGLFIVFVLM